MAMALLLTIVLLAICAWLAFEAPSGRSDDQRPLERGLFVSHGWLWLALGSLVLSVVMAKFGIPFFFVFIPPVFLVFRSGSRRD